MNADYISYIRGFVGHECIILNFAGGTVFDNQNRILLQYRSDKKAWGFLGGAIEIGESAEDAVIREVYEESGLRVSIQSFQGIYTKYFDVYPNGDKAQTITHFFILKHEGGVLNTLNTETLDLKFFDLSSISRLFNQQHTDILEDLKHSAMGVYR